MFSFQSCQEATAPEIDGSVNPNTSLLKSVSSRQKKGSDMTPKEKEEFTNTLKDIAKGLAILFKEESNRKLLEIAIKTSEKKEQILEASKFLNQVNSISINGQKSNITFREAINEVLPDARKEIFNSKINELPFGLVDIFFPLKEYRDNWKSNDNLQVVALGWNEKIKDKEATCYSLDGDEFVIPTNEKPHITTLVVYPSEKRGNYRKNNSNNSTYTNLQKRSSIASTNSESPSYRYEFWTGGAQINYEYDDGLEGYTLEIFFEFKIKYPGGNWSDWKDCSESDDMDVDPDGEFHNFDYKVMHTGERYYKLKLRMLDWDFWSSNDIVADGTSWVDGPSGTDIAEFIHIPNQSGWYHIIHDDDIDNESVYKTKRIIIN